MDINTITIPVVQLLNVPSIWTKLYNDKNSLGLTDEQLCTIEAVAYEQYQNNQYYTSFYRWLFAVSELSTESADRICSKFLSYYADKPQARSSLLDILMYCGTSKKLSSEMLLIAIKHVIKTAYCSPDIHEMLMNPRLTASDIHELFTFTLCYKPTQGCVLQKYSEGFLRNPHFCLEDARKWYAACEVAKSREHMEIFAQWAAFPEIQHQFTKSASPWVKYYLAKNPKLDKEVAALLFKNNKKIGAVMSALANNSATPMFILLQLSMHEYQNVAQAARETIAKQKNHEYSTIDTRQG